MANTTLDADTNPVQFLYAKELLISSNSHQDLLAIPELKVLGLSYPMECVARSVLKRRYPHRCSYGSWSQFLKHSDTIFEDILYVLQESYRIRKSQIERLQP